MQVPEHVLKHSNQFRPDDVMLIMKSGRDVLRERLPPQLETFASTKEGRNIRNTIILSDYATKIGGYEVIDIVSHLKDDPVVNASQKYRVYLDVHNRLQKHGEEPQWGKAPGTNDEGWSVDALKNIPGYLYAWNTYKTKWYYGVDDDTYVIWPSLFEFLSLLNPDKKSYIGSANILLATGNQFMHGGTGILLSRAAMKERFEERKDGLAAFNAHAAELCCGDAVLGMAMTDAGIEGRRAFEAFFHGSHIQNMAFKEDRVCQVMLSFHHITPAAMRFLHERLHGRGIMTWADVFLRVAPSTLEKPELTERHDWDFIQSGDDGDKTAVQFGDERSAEICRYTCEQNGPVCLGWSFDRMTEKCLLSSKLTPGKKHEGMISGVNLPRLATLQAECRKPEKDWKRYVIDQELHYA